MLRAVLCWLTAAAANNALSDDSMVSTCLAMASKPSLECRTELLRGTSALSSPHIVQAAFAGSSAGSQKDEESAYLKSECRILQASRDSHWVCNHVCIACLFNAEFIFGEKTIEAGQVEANESDDLCSKVLQQASEAVESSHETCLRRS